jgi:hypothetical protein
MKYLFPSSNLSFEAYKFQVSYEDKHCFYNEKTERM